MLLPRSSISSRARNGLSHLRIAHGFVINNLMRSTGGQAGTIGSSKHVLRSFKEEEEEEASRHIVIRGP